MVAAQKSKSVAKEGSKDAKKANKRKISQKYCARIPKLRASLKPGTVLILLKGHHQAKRVILLHKFNSGLLLVTGPKKINGCPVMRVHPKHVIATSERLQLPEVTLKKCQKIKENSLKCHVVPQSTQLSKEEAAKYRAHQILDAKKVKKRDARQNKIDESIIKVIDEGDAFKKQLLFGYLKTPFSLNTNSKPHLMNF